MFFKTHLKLTEFTEWYWYIGVTRGLLVTPALFFHGSDRIDLNWVELNWMKVNFCLWSYVSVLKLFCWWFSPMTRHKREQMEAHTKESNFSIFVLLCFFVKYFFTNFFLLYFSRYYIYIFLNLKPPPFDSIALQLDCVVIFCTLVVSFPLFPMSQVGVHNHHQHHKQHHHWCCFIYRNHSKCYYCWATICLATVMILWCWCDFYFPIFSFITKPDTLTQVQVLCCSSVWW